MFDKYNKLLKKSNNALMISTDSNETKTTKRYLNTDIYKASREISKMQRLDSKVLTTWVEPQNKKIRLKRQNRIIK